MELHLLIAAVRRRRALIALTALTAVLLGFVVSRASADSYRATATLLLDPTSITAPGQEAFAGDPERYIEGQLRVLGSPELAMAVADDVEGADADDVRAARELDHVIGSDVVEVSATSPDPERAAALANALGRAYVSTRAQASADAVAAEVARTESELQEVETGLADAPPDAPATRLLLSRFEQLLDQRTALNSPGVIRDRTAVLVQATEPSNPERPSTVVVGLASLVVGGTLGLALALLFEARDPRVASRAHVERALGLRLAAHMPGARGRRRRRGPAAAQGARAAATVAALIESADRAGATVVAVSDLSTDRDASDFAEALSQEMARRGSRVALATRRALSPEAMAAAGPHVTTDSTSDLVHRLEPPAGEGGSTGSGVAFRADGNSFAAEPSQALERYVRQLDGRFDVVVLDFPPLLERPLAARAATWCSDLVLLVPVPGTRTKDLGLVTDLLDGRAARVRPVTTKS